MRKKSFFYVLMTCIMCLFFVLTGCNNNTERPSSGATGDTGTYYTVTFDSRGGSTVKSQRIHEGNPAVRPQTPTYSGYFLTGWFKQDNTEWNFDTDRVNSDITLYAGWQVEESAPVVPGEPEITSEVYMTFGNEIVTAQLYDNATARDLFSRLPLTLSFSDFNNTEKIAYIDRKSVV